jgi:hypothetical protein
VTAGKPIFEGKAISLKKQEVAGRLAISLRRKVSRRSAGGEGTTRTAMPRLHPASTP